MSNCFTRMFNKETRMGVVAYLVYWGLRLDVIIDTGELGMEDEMELVMLRENIRDIQNALLEQTW